MSTPKPPDSPDDIESRHKNEYSKAESTPKSFNDPIEVTEMSDRQKPSEANKTGTATANRISWLLWKATSKIREPILYLVILILAIVYLELSPLVIGLSEQNSFRKDIDKLIDQNPMTSSIQFGPSTFDTYELCPSNTYSIYDRTASSHDSLDQGFASLLWMFQFARVFDTELGCPGCSFGEASLHDRADLKGMWLRTDNPPSTAISSERVHIDFTFHDGFLYDIQEDGQVRILGNEETQGIVIYSRSIQDLYDSGNCLEKLMLRKSLRLDVDMDFTYLNETECFSSEGVLTVNRQFLCAEDFKTFINSLLEGYVKGDCEGKGIECIEFEVYVPVLLKPKTVCDIEYLAVAIYDTSTDNVNIKFVPKDLYPPECRFYYIFSQIFVFILVFSLTLVLKCINAVAQYNIMKKEGENFASTVRKMIYKSMNNGWFWLDCIVYTLALLLIITYAIYLRRHTKFFNDFDEKDFQSGFEESSEPDTPSVLSRLRSACENSKVDASEWGEDSSAYPALCYMVPILFETWGIEAPENSDWLEISQDLDQLISTGSGCAVGDVLACDFDFDQTIPCEEIVSDDCFSAYQQIVRSYLELIAEGVEVSDCDERDRLVECTFDYYNSVHEWMFNSVLDSDDSTASGNDVASWASIYDQDSKSLTNQFNRLHDSQEDFQTVSAYLILFLCLRLLRYATVDSRLELILNALKRASTPLSYFFLAFIIVFIGFVVFAQIYLGFFGVDAMLLNLVFVKGVVCITGYQSFGDAFVTASNLLFDPFDFDEISFLSDEEKTFFYIWYYLFVAVLVLTFMNLIIAILVISLEEEWEEMKRKKIRTMRSSFLRFLRLFGGTQRAVKNKKKELATVDNDPKDGDTRLRYIKVLSSAIILYDTTAEELLSAVITIQSYFRGYLVRKKKIAGTKPLKSRSGKQFSKSIREQQHYAAEETDDSKPALENQISQMQQELQEVRSFMKETLGILKQMQQANVEKNDTG